MPKKKVIDSDFIVFNVIYQDGSLSSNRRIAKEELDIFEPDDSAKAIIEAQDRKIAALSGRPRGPIKIDQPRRRALDYALERNRPHAAHCSRRGRAIALTIRTPVVLAPLGSLVIRLGSQTLRLALGRALFLKLALLVALRLLGAVALGPLLIVVRLECHGVSPGRWAQ